MLLEFLTPDFSHADERGSLIQLVHNGWKQFNVITSAKGCVRGNHYHKANTEAFYLIKGSFQLTLKQGKICEQYEITAGMMFLIPPGVNHTFHYIEDTLLVSMYDHGVELADGTKDIFTDF